MDYLYFILFIAFLVGILILLTRLEARTKRRKRKAAYDLLEQPAPSQKDILDTIKGLRLYGGRWRKDKEFIQLISKLQQRLKGEQE